MNETIKKALFEKRTNLALRVAIALVVAPIVAFAAGSVIVAGILVLACAIGQALVPAATVRISALKYRALEAAVNADPIAAAWQQYYAEGEELNKNQKLIQSQMAEIDVYRGGLEDFEKEFGTPPKPHQLERLSNFETIVEYRMEAYKQAVVAHNEDGHQLKMDESTYKLDQASIKLSESMDIGNDDWQARFIKDRVNSALTRKRAEAMAAMRMAASLKDIKQLKDKKVAQVLPAAPAALEYDNNGRVLTKLIDVEQHTSAFATQA